MDYLGQNYKRINDPFESIGSHQSGSVCTNIQLWDWQRPLQGFKQKWLLCIPSLYFLSYSHYFILLPTTTTSRSLTHTKFSSLNLSQSEVWELPFSVRFVTFFSSNCSCYELFGEGSVPVFKKFNFSKILLQSSMLLISSFLFSSLISLWKNKFLYNVVNIETYYTLVCIFKPRCICN